MTKIVDGKLLAQEIANQLISQVDKLRQYKINPKLAIVGIEPDTRSLVYINMKIKRAKEIGIQAEFIDLSGNSRSECITKVTELSKNPKIHGIVIQLPLSGWYDPQDLIDYINPAKDVDGLTSTSQDALEDGHTGLRPATPLAVMSILNTYDVELKDKTVTVVGRSHLVGTPLRYMLENAGAKVLVAHRQTQDLKSHTLKSDIVVSAAGSPGLITGDMVKNDVVVIDVGINDVDGKLRGDIDFDSVAPKASIITPVPGGVGPMTVVMLLQNIVQAIKMKNQL